MKWIKAAVGKQVKLIPVDEVLYFQSDTSTRASCSRSRRGVDPHAAQGAPRRARPRASSGRCTASTIVNLDAVAGVLREDAERQFVLLKNRQEKLPISRQFTHLFKQM